MIEFPHLYRANAPAGTSAAIVTRVLELERAQATFGVQPIYTLRHLAHLSDVSYTFLRGVTTRSIDPYDVYSVRKRDGKSVRSIAAPNEPLKIAQRWLLDNVFSRFEMHPASFAYRTGISVRHCAESHLGCRWLVKLDLRDFFHQTDETDIHRLLLQYRYSPLVAFEIARIATRMPRVPQDWLPRKYSIEPTRREDPGMPYSPQRLGYVPQGAPTSGAITNALAIKLDHALYRVAGEEGLVYTRYADDLTFSSSGAFTRSTAARVVRSLNRSISAGGYELNPAKTRIIAPGRRLEVLGILVDGAAPRLSNRTRNRIEYHLRGIEQFGIRSHQTHAGFDDAIGMLHFLRGLIDYAWDVEPTRARDYLDRLAAVTP